MKTVKYFTHKKINYSSLDDAMKTLCFNPIYDTPDANAATTFLISEIDRVIKDNTQTIYIPNRRRIKKPWMTAGLIRCVKNRDRLHQKLKKYPNDEIIKITYKRYRNFCNRLLKNIKQDYERNLLKKAAHTNNKALWETVKKLAYSSKINSPAYDLLSTTNPLESVNDINNFFVSIGRTLAEKAYIAGTYCKTSSVSSHSFVLQPTDESEVLSHILSLKKRQHCWEG